MNYPSSAAAAPGLCEAPPSRGPLLIRVNAFTFHSEALCRPSPSTGHAISRDRATHHDRLELRTYCSFSNFVGPIFFFTVIGSCSPGRLPIYFSYLNRNLNPHLSAMIETIL